MSVIPFLELSKLIFDNEIYKLKHFDDGDREGYRFEYEWRDTGRVILLYDSNIFKLNTIVDLKDYLAPYKVFLNSHTKMSNDYFIYVRRSIFNNINFIKLHNETLYRENDLVL